MQLQRPGDALALCDEAYKTATERNIYPSSGASVPQRRKRWRSWEKPMRQLQEWQRATATIHELAAAIRDKELQQGFLAASLSGPVRPERLR